MRSASTVLLVTLRQTLVARAAASVHAVSLSIRVAEAPAFHADQDHSRTRRLSQSASTALLVSPQAKKEAPVVAIVSPASFKTRESKRRAKHASVVLRAKVETKLRNDARQERTLIALDPCRAFHALQDRLRVLKEV